MCAAGASRKKEDFSIPQLRSYIWQPADFDPFRSAGGISMRGGAGGVGAERFSGP